MGHPAIVMGIELKKRAGERTAGPSTTLRSGRDDNSFAWADFLGDERQIRTVADLRPCRTRLSKRDDP
jgi:hypothetical protein